MTERLHRKDILHAGHGARAGETVSDLRLLIRLVFKDSEGVGRCLATHPDGINRLAVTCAKAGLSVVLLQALEDSPYRSLLASSLMDALEESRSNQKYRQKRLSKTLLALAGYFHAAKQPFILLKGPYLSTRFYKNTYAREYVDVDILVPRIDREEAIAILNRAGFRRRSGTLFGEKATSFFVHGFDFFNDNARVDLHWRLSRHPSLRLDDKKLWADRSSFVVDGNRYDVLSDEHEIIFAALSLLRDIERGRPKPKNIVDIMQILATIDKHIDWEALFCARNGTGGPLLNVLNLCLDVTDAHNRVPYLSGALARCSRRPVSIPEEVSPMRFRPVPYGLGNKLWALKVYETGPIAWFVWWMLSLPFRLAVHKPPNKAGTHGRHGCNRV